MAPLRNSERKTGVGFRFAGIVAAVAMQVGLLFGVGHGQATAGQVVLTWDMNTEPDLAGYKIYYGTASGVYGTPMDVGNVTTFTVTGLTDGQPYFFAATAYDIARNESGHSNEISRTPSGPLGINLVGNAVTIFDGASAPSPANFTDFGDRVITVGAVTRTFTIQNLGTGVLTLSGTPLVAVSGTNAADFSVTAQPAASVAAARSTTFSVTFDPSATGNRTATLTIASSDTTKNPYNFAILGRGLASHAAPKNLRIVP